MKPKRLEWIHFRRAGIVSYSSVKNHTGPTVRNHAIPFWHLVFMDTTLCGISVHTFEGNRWHRVEQVQMNPVKHGRCKQCTKLQFLLGG